MPNLKVISNKVNIGPDANFLRAVELSEGEYTWVVCDDDTIDLAGFAEVLDVIKKGEVNLIHVGAHPEQSWNKFAGRMHNPQDLVKAGYPFFKFSSFLPNNIFKTALFQKEMIRAYRNIVYSLPHMPFFMDQYEQGHPIYVSQHQIVTATLGSTNYTVSNFYYWWMYTSKLLKNKADVRLMFLDQWRNIDRVYQFSGLDVLNLLLTKGNDKRPVQQFINDYLTFDDKVYMFKKRFMGGAFFDLSTTLTIAKKNLIKTISGDKEGNTAPLN